MLQLSLLYVTRHVSDVSLTLLQEYINSMTDEAFEKHRTALAVERSVKPKTLGEECKKYWKEMKCSEYQFNRGK